MKQAVLGFFLCMLVVLLDIDDHCDIDTGGIDEDESEQQQSLGGWECRILQWMVCTPQL
jgi:hypothetical protein